MGKGGSCINTDYKNVDKLSSDISKRVTMENLNDEFVYFADDHYSLFGLGYAFSFVSAFASGLVIFDQH